MERKRLWFKGSIDTFRRELKLLEEQSGLTYVTEKSTKVSTVVCLNKNYPGDLGLDLSVNNKLRKNPIYRLGDTEPHYRKNRDTRPRAEGVIYAITQGDRVRVEVELDTDSTKRFYKEVHERWAALYEHLVDTGRLDRTNNSEQNTAQEQSRADILVAGRDSSKLKALLQDLDGIGSAREPGQQSRVKGEIAPTPKHELYQSNRWLIEQYFEKGRTNYQELVNDWLAYRERELKSRPQNPVASMRTVISEERKRRGIA